MDKFNKIKGIEKVFCIGCGRGFYRYKEGNKKRIKSLNIRQGRTITCSKSCSVKYNSTKTNFRSKVRRKTPKGKRKERIRQRIKYYTKKIKIAIQKRKV